MTLTLSSGTFAGGSSTTTATASSGVATFSSLVINTVGTYTMKATDGSLGSARSSSVTISPAAVEVMQRELGRVLVLLGGGDRNWRVIYTDGRAQGQADEAVRGYYGTSVGHWEKDTLVVDTIGFNERFWMTNGGLPHTEALHLTERFTRTGPDDILYQFTVEDPASFTRPWSAELPMRRTDEHVYEYACHEGNYGMEGILSGARTDEAKASAPR